MYVLGIAGPSDAGKTTLVERLAERLSERGSVATVKHLTHSPDVDTDGKDTARHRAAGAQATYGITDDEGWFATGADRTLVDALDELAPDYDYALVEGFSDAAIPTVALGGRDHEGARVTAAPTADDLALDSVVDALHEREPYETLGSLAARVKRSARQDRAGAIATFTGRVRERDGPDDDPTEHLAFEKYDGVAEERLAAIRSDLLDRDGIFEVALHHKTGVVEASEDIVFVVILAGHRAEAFEAVEDGINRLKDEVPLFKKEVTVSDEFWAHESE
ncbi:molybdopterin synthase [Halomicrobium zhouii]|uniref:molybdopterin synthase n=1 Tax=Halomicrobium zhouii TaxID=767519 RepID=UPI000B7FAE44|nr:molybdopterin synthase [Halomicrobium zhouii]